MSRARGPPAAHTQLRSGRGCGSGLKSSVWLFTATPAEETFASRPQPPRPARPPRGGATHRLAAPGAAWSGRPPCRPLSSPPGPAAAASSPASSRAGTCAPASAAAWLRGRGQVSARSGPPPPPPRPPPPPAGPARLTRLAVQRLRELVDGGRHLQPLVEDRALPLQPDVARPLDEARQVPLGLDVLTCGGGRRAVGGGGGGGPGRGRPRRRAGISDLGGVRVVTRLR